MSAGEKPPALPGAKWVGAWLQGRGVFGAVNEVGDAVIWWSTRPDLGWHPGTDTETAAIFIAWALAERARAEAAEAKLAAARAIVVEHAWDCAVHDEEPCGCVVGRLRAALEE